ncbi:FAD-dependent oxidoreductase [Streptomyces echinoruber]|jgi:salicylate hydroxylase|uniref:Monooxygenase (salicylate/ hydroxybenzoate hydroxylase) n=1 Tax=Streptomyces echinoruber TaxID=68898 RepID=A0A918RH76_9ACTN|nr:FAD-dependent oxidoreductase [Streptomyces echinoruber]GGZ97915.1 putative monooxygenase (salicylate/ hydroxybenzoate hydroxylase [Streptomyces echinoruber]
MIRAVITGGGIGGLAAALSLARRGHRVLVLERAPEFAEIGAGIQLAPNGLHALDRLGVGDEARAVAVRMDELRFMDGVTGEHVTSLPLTETYRRRFGNPYVVVHRAELHSLLLRACRAHDAVALRGGSTVQGYERDAAGATAVLASGERITGDALIGADGMHSAVRRQLVGDGAPRVSGITVHRAVIPMDRVPRALRRDTSVVWWTGPGCHFVHYPIAGGRYLNLAGSRHDGGTEAFSGVPADNDHVRRQFTALGPDVQRLVELGDGWRSWMLVDRDPVAGWTDGRVTLLGDAAHPMIHYAAQGACQALEDAVHLGDLLQDACADDVAQRLEKYNADRRERTAAIQLAARESVRLWHPAGAEARARNAMLRALTADDLHDHVAWMHGARDFGATTPPPPYLPTPWQNGVRP